MNVEEIKALCPEFATAIDYWYSPEFPPNVTHRVMEALAEARQQLAEREWRPIESAAKDGSFIDLFGNGNRYTRCFYSVIDCFWVQEVRYVQRNLKRKTIKMQVINPTHWMPLPQPPDQNAGYKPHPLDALTPTAKGD